MPDQAGPPILTDRFHDAFELASTLHRPHVRKGTSVPYLSHLMSAAALVLEDGGDEDEAIAAQLHDARSILRDHRADPAGVWDRFSLDGEDTLWFHGELVQAYRKSGQRGYLMEEPSRVVGELHIREGWHAREEPEAREGWQARDEPANREGVDRWEPG